MQEELSEAHILGAVDLFLDANEKTLIRIFPHGVENSNCHIQVDGADYVIRFYGAEHSQTGSRSKSHITFELKFMQAAARAGLPVAPIVRTKTGELFAEHDGAQVVLFGFMEGEAPTNFSPDMTRQVAETLAHMHTMATSLDIQEERTSNGSLLEALERRLEKYEDPDLRTENELTSRIDPILADFRADGHVQDIQSLERYPIHNDVIYHNIAFHEGQLSAVFDFDDCHRGAFLDDIMRTAFKYLDEPSICITGDSGEHCNPMQYEGWHFRMVPQKESYQMPALLKE